MKRIQLILASLLILGFTGLGVHNVVANENKIKLREIELKSTTTELKELELRYDGLNKNLEKELHEKTQNQEKIEQLEKEKQDLEKKRQELEQQLSAKREAARLAAEKIRNAASFTSKAYAASGSCADWIVAAGITDTYNATELIRRESGCNPYAVNKSSGACGVAQELPCGKSGCSLGDGACQVKWMNGYVMGRYGSWAAAVSFHDRNNWY